MTDPVQELERQTRELTEYMHDHNRTVFGRYPLLFSLLGTFGVAAVLYGLEGILDQIQFFREIPEIPLLAGILVLVFTGTLYKRIEKKLD